MKKLLALLTLSVAGTVFAVPTDILIDFDAPTIREDGDPITDADIAEYKFYDNCVGAPAEFLTVPNTGGVAEATTTVDWADGTQHSICFTAVETDGTEGLFSDAYNFTFDLIGRPGAGSIRSITVTCVSQRCRVTLN